MKWLAVSLALAAVAGTSGCWRPYYGHNYAPPAYQQAPQVYQQPAPVMQAAPVMQPQQVCPPQPCCQPCY